MKTLNYLEAMELATKQMANGGVFLTVKGEKNNTMTIGWGSIGWFWNRPVFLALVRPSRYTFDILNRTGEFTVSVPLDDQMAEQLRYAGRVSGRDEDKFSGHGLTAAPAQTLDTPIIEECALHFECTVRLWEDMTSAHMDESVARRAYASGDLHRMFFGEIVACYRTDIV